jgi:hypothetical protein
MNAAATSGEEETAVKKGDGENGRHSMVGADHVAATATQTLTDSDEKSAEVTVPDITATTSADDSESSPQATTQPAGAEESVSDELPRKRRGILLGTHPGPATPDAVDDGKSLSWMATQAVKAVNAVKASQLEQAQAWKAGAGMPEDEQSGQAEEDSAAIDARESVAMERQAPVQPPPGGEPATTEAVPPVESSQEAATTPRIPPGPRAATPRVPARMALMLGVLMMFSYAGYRYWFSDNRAASDVTATTPVIIESAGPAEEVNMMTPPAISVVAAPEPAADHSTPPAAEAEMATPPVPATAVQPATAGPAAEEVKLMTPPAISVVPAPQPAAEHSTPPAVEAGMAPMPGPATESQPATAGVAPQPAPANPASAAKPEAWYPSAVPAAPAPAPAPAAAAEADMSTRQPASPSSPPPVEADAVASQPAPPSTPPPAVEANVPARQPVAPAPAARPRYPANGYGYYQPPSSWQPYYQPGYQQAPARR